MALLWIAVVFGVLVGWVWRPKWATGFGRDVEDFFPGSFSSFKMQLSGIVRWNFSDGFSTNDSSSSLSGDSDSSLANVDGGKISLVGDADLRHLDLLVEVKDEGPEWIPMMDKNTPTLR